MRESWINANELKDALLLIAENKNTLTIKEVYELIRTKEEEAEE